MRKGRTMAELIAVEMIFARWEISYIQTAEQLSCICLIEQAGPGEAGETLSTEARGSDKSPGPLFVPSKIER